MKPANHVIRFQALGSHGEICILANSYEDAKLAVESRKVPASLLLEILLENSLYIDGGESGGSRIASLKVDFDATKEEVSKCVSD